LRYLLLGLRANHPPDLVGSVAAKREAQSLARREQDALDLRAF